MNNNSLNAATQWMAFPLCYHTFAFTYFRLRGRRKIPLGIDAYQLLLAEELFEYSRRKSFDNSSGIRMRSDGYVSLPDPFIPLWIITFYPCIWWWSASMKHPGAKSIQLVINCQKLGTNSWSNVEACNKLPLICCFTVYFTLTHLHWHVTKWYPNSTLTCLHACLQ